MSQPTARKVVAQEERDILVSALRDLTRTERILLGLYFYEGLSSEQIARVLNLPDEDVAERLEQILQRLPLVPREQDPHFQLVQQIFG